MGTVARNAWNETQDDLLRRLWASAAAHEILAAFPLLSWNALAHRASRLNAKRSRPETPPSVAVVAWASSGDARRGRGIASPQETRDGVLGKRCLGSCAEWRPLERFTRHSSCAGGRRSICTTCEGEKARRANPERIREAARKRYAGVAVGVSLDEIAQLRAAYGGACAYCDGTATTIDHVIPLAQGGPHLITNLVPACGRCNFQKGNRTPDQWRAGTLAPQYANREKGV